MAHATQVAAAGCLLLLTTLAGPRPAAGEPGMSAKSEPVIRLPEPKRDGTMSLEQSLERRRSVRSYAKDPLTLAQASQLLWAAQGITSRDGRRTAPSAGALYGLELYLVAGNVRDLASGIYRYRPQGHDLLRIVDADRRAELCAAAHGQSQVKSAPAVLVFTGVYERIARKYGARAERYTHMEVGHAAQNVCLEATALGLGTVPMGAFDDGRVGRVLGLPPGEQPLYILPLGRPE